ncbi:hypothetical protein [Actinophytocola sp.]|uniref:hypothetical protein n=1 Tax=Actinophytocola sp. TaxID=1872138 RepID=UPI00389A7EAF
MTSTETQSGDVPAELNADLEALTALANECWANQALFRLVDPTQAHWQGLRGPGEHLVEVEGVSGVLNLGLRAFVPDDYDALTERLRAKLVELVGDRPVSVGTENAEVDWTTMAIVEDAPQPARTITVTASSVPDDTGVYYDLVLDTDPEGGVAVQSHERVGDPDAELVTEETILAGIAAEVGAEVPATADEGTEAEHGGITAAYLGDYYGADPVPFEDTGYVVDWTTWAPDQQADGGRLGSPMTGHDQDGREFALYVWFGPATGARIVSAAPVGGAEEAAADPRAVFEADVLPRWFEVCRSRGSTLETDDGARYDVGRWVDDASSDHSPELLDFDGRAFLVSLRAFTGDEVRQEVRLRLLVSDVERVRVDAVEPV